MAQSEARLPFVLNALELNYARFDQPTNPVRDKLFLCSSQRTGSFLLCRAMVHHGLGVPHEYFNTRHIAKLGPRLGIPALQYPPLRDGWTIEVNPILRAEYIRALLAHRTVEGVFAAKVQWWQYESYLDNPEGRELMEGGHFVYLYREDLLDQAISLHLALLSGRWGLNGAVTSQPRGGEIFDADAISRCLNEMADADKKWRLFFALKNIKPLFVSYEGLISNPTDIVRKIGDRFGLSPQPAPDYTETRVHPQRNPGEPTSRELKEWFLGAQLG